VEYSGGQQYDLAQLAQHAHDHGALLVVDGAQSLGAIPVDVTALGVDALVASGYKWLCGPFGAAVMYLAPQLQVRLEPGVVGFRSHEDMWDLQATRLELPKTARRFEPSTMAYGCALGLAASIKYLLRVGVPGIRDHNLELADLLVDGLRKRRAEIVGPQRDEERSSIVAARFPDCSAVAMAQHLNAARVVVSARQSTVRFSPHLYNEPADIERALEEIDRVRR
jgi:selenocysteine lyase/cysteine desulfurase